MRKIFLGHIYNQNDELQISDGIPEISLTIQTITAATTTTTTVAYALGYT